MEIEKDHLEEVCLMGQGEKCCRYIIAHPDDGIVCAKDRPNLKYAIDARVNQMTAKEDNCEGWNTHQPPQPNPNPN